MKRVRDLMTEVVETLGLGQTIGEAAELMRLGGIRHLPVVDGLERLLGIVTQRNILSAWVSHGVPHRETPGAIAHEIPVEAIMETEVVTVAPDTSAAQAARVLETRKIGCLPVVEGGKLVGIITEADFVRFARQHFDDEATDDPL